MTARYCQWARSEVESAQMTRDGWTADLQQPMTRHHHYSLLMVWLHMDREPPPQAPDQAQFRGAI